MYALVCVFQFISSNPCIVWKHTSVCVPGMFLQKPVYCVPLEDHLKATDREIAEVIEECVCAILDIGLKEEVKQYYCLLVETIIHNLF